MLLFFSDHRPPPSLFTITFVPVYNSGIIICISMGIKKNRKELLAELELNDKLEVERRTSDRLYAIKLVEKIVFTLVALLLTGVIMALMNLVFK